MPRANAQPVRLSAALIDEIKGAAELSGHSVPMEIERRLRQSLDAGSAASATPWARAIGHLMTFLADDVAEYSQSADEALVKMRAAAPALLDELFEGYRAVLGDETATLTEDEAKHAESDGRMLGAQVRKAHESTRRSEETRDIWGSALAAQMGPGNLKQGALKKAQEALLLTPAALAKMASAISKVKTRKRPAE